MYENLGGVVQNLAKIDNFSSKVKNIVYKSTRFWPRIESGYMVVESGYMVVESGYHL